MFFKRKMYDRLVEWKNRDAGRSALLIEGARRVGKTSLVREFGKNEYRSVAFIDFFKTPKAVIKVFEEESDDIAVLLKRLSATLGIRFYPRETLIIFDEVQFYPRARGLVKYLVEDGQYDYIETGSLISIRKNVNDIVIPSEERSVRLDPMDFEEFLWALGDEAAIPYTKECFDCGHIRVHAQPAFATGWREIISPFRIGQVGEDEGIRGCVSLVRRGAHRGKVCEHHRSVRCRTVQERGTYDFQGVHVRHGTVGYAYVWHRQHQ